MACSMDSRAIADGDYDVVTRDFGKEWFMIKLTFKPYATGTMNQPYIDCALRLARKGFAADDVAEVLCETAEGYVHRLWDPLLPSSSRQRLRGEVQRAVQHRGRVCHRRRRARRVQREDRARSAHPRARRQGALRGRSGQSVPEAFTGHVRMTLKDGRVFEERQPHIRGGAHEPLSREDIERKFRGNVGLRRLDRCARRSVSAIREQCFQR